MAIELPVAVLFFSVALFLSPTWRPRVAKHKNQIVVEKMDKTARFFFFSFSHQLLRRATAAERARVHVHVILTGIDFREQWECIMASGSAVRVVQRR